MPGGTGPSPKKVKTVWIHLMVHIKMCKVNVVVYFCRFEAELEQRSPLKKKFTGHMKTIPISNLLTRFHFSLLVSQGSVGFALNALTLTDFEVSEFDPSLPTCKNDPTFLKVAEIFESSLCTKLGNIFFLFYQCNSK